MKLSRLEIYGFKSFAKKLDLRLTGGITAIVGPNGCGKTNIVDAIRWVLGEQRPTQIRLERMEDVLFKGSATRRQLGMSEVSLTIENDDGLLPLNMPEITITRRLFRSGESEYMINRKPCRLADINDLLMDTGMGTDSYSLFELSMINAILSDKTDDRRHIFEEAAGITKYKARRRSALNKLAGIESDLERVGDIIGELGRRVESLKRQASKAKRYRRLKEEIRSRTIALAAFEMERHREKIDALTGELETLRASIESTKGKISRNAAETERLSAEIVDVEKELEETGAGFSASLAEITEREKELARLESRLESLDEITERAREALRRNSAALEELAESHGGCAGKIEEVSARLAEIEREYRRISASFAEIREEAAEKTASYARMEEEYRRIERELAGHKAALAGVRLRREGNEKRLREVTARMEELGKSAAGLDRALEEVREEKLSRLYEEKGLSSKLSGLKESLDRCSAELSAVDSRFRDTVKRRAEIRAEHDFLAEVMKSCEGYSDGVKAAVRSDAVKGRVLGILGDVVSADERYVPAVEAALRESLQTVLVESADDALAGARFLSGGGHGRAAFLPVDGTRAGAVPKPVPEAPGVIGPAFEFVRTEDRFAPVVKRLLSDVVIVDTMETAVALHKSEGEERNATRYVTLSGELVGRWGDIHAGGAADSQAGVIGRMEKLKRLAAALEETGKEAEKLQEKRDELSQNADVLRGMISELESMLDRTRRELYELSSREAETKAKRESALDTIENLRKEAEALEAAFAGFESEMAEIEKEIGVSEEDFGRLGERLRAAKAELGELKTEMEKRRTALNACEVERAALLEKKAALARELETIGERRESLARSCNRINREIEDAEREILDTGNRKKELLERLETLERNHETLKRKKDEIERRHADLRAERSEKERALQRLRRELDEKSRAESSLVLRRDETVMLMNNIEQRLREEYFIGPDDSLEVPDEREFDPGNEKLLLEDLRRKIHQLGDVNLAAEADYEEEKERLDFLRRERDDLVEAGETLKETIVKINSIARARFTETFSRIRENFQKMFNEFFEGGVCDLELEETEDPLEAGIKITARPPGKNVRSINLLSSGERALTAISLLFAIYLVKPSPFCILDEVDAPLDDANIDRYLKVIRRFSESTQFIMVTHNKKTMAEADNLYGITMEEPGLSTLVSVRLSETEPAADGGTPAGKEKEEIVGA